MTLAMKMFKDKVRFEWTDGEVESVVTLTTEDSEESALRKLKRVIALVEGEPATPPPGVPEYGVLRTPKYPALDALPPQPANGWAAVYGPPELPEDRKADWELVQPGEGE